MGIAKEININDESFDLDIHETKEALAYCR